MNSSHEVLGVDDRLQTYPSPDPDGQEESGSFFNTAAGQRDTHQADHSQHQAPHAASVEELQLAAQLGQDLATEPMMSVTDPTMKFDDASLRTIMPHPDESALRDISHSGDHSVPRPYVPHNPDQSVTPALPSAHIQIPMGSGISQTFASGNDGTTPPRKRSKVSRACDECRRKKVKCDAQTDTGDTPCSNCKRSSQRCSFSRIPQKRGPSKGYIKELADRIHSIEGRLGDNTTFQTQGPADEHGRKRAFSSISNGDLHAPSGIRTSNLAWGPEPHPQTQPPQPSSSPERLGMSYQPNGLAPHPIGLKPDNPLKPSTTGLDNIGSDLPDLTQPRDLDDEVFQGYIAIIHPYLPILPANKARLQVYLAQCSGMLREAFLEALIGTLQSFPSFASAIPGDVGLGKKLLVEWELNDDAPRTQAAHIVHLQTIILLLIEADVRPSGCTGTQKESLLGRAVGTAWALRLHQACVEWKLDGETDTDSDAHIRVRLWWSLVILDRWNAVSMGTPTMTHRQSVVVQSSLSAVIGEGPCLLLRLSKVMDRVAAVILTLQQNPGQTGQADRVLAAFLDDYVENFREDLPGYIDPLSYPVVHLSYWHCRLLVYLLDPSAKALDVLWPCRELVALFEAVPDRASPFHHHFRALTMLTLVELGRLDKTKEEANKLLADLRKLPSASNAAWDGIVGDGIAELLAQAGNDQGMLQQLADVATSSSGATEADKLDGVLSHRSTLEYENMGFDPRPLLTTGYFKFIWASHVQA